MPGSDHRIALLSVHSCPFGRIGGKDTGGMSVYVREIAHELGAQGFLVDMFTRRHGGGHAEVAEVGSGIRLVHIEAGPDGPLGKVQVHDYLQDFASNLQEFGNREGLDYDLVYSHYWLSGLVGAEMARRWSAPHVTMFHTLGAAKNASGSGEQEPRLRIEGERRVCGACDRIIAATPNERNDLVQCYDALPERITVVPCGVNLDRFRPMDKGAARRRLGLGDQKIILFVGRIEPVKGLERLIRAVSYLDHRAGVKLVIIGGDEHSSEEVQRLRNLARDLHVGPAVEFWGLVEHEQMPCFYNAADVCALVSYYESFGLVALESLACGTPVVAGDVGVMREVIRRDEMGRVLSRDHSPLALAHMLAEYTSRPAPDPYAVREGVTRYGWANIAHQVGQVFSEVGRQSRGTRG